MSTSSENSKSVPVSRREQRSSAQAFIDNLKGMAHPNSRRIFIQGSRSDIRVGLREIVLADTFVGGSKEDPQFEPNDPVPVYDTSGAYGDESAEIDVRRDLPRPQRFAWLALSLAGLLFALHNGYALEMAVRTGLYDFRQATLSMLAGLLAAFAVHRFRRLAE